MVVKTVSRLAQWKSTLDNYCNLRSVTFKMGMWNWQLSICMQDGRLYISLILEPSKGHLPFAKFILRLTTGAGTERQQFVSQVYKRHNWKSDDFYWAIESSLFGSFIMEVEFLDLKVHSANGHEARSFWPSYGMLKSSASASSLSCLSRMLHDSINADITINTCDGTLKAHKAILSASSPVFLSMFQHNLKENTSSTIDIQDMSLDSCTVLVSYLYGTIKHEDFWKHRLALLGAANKYALSSLKGLCEESLLDDINTGNVLERLQEARLYQLDKLKKGCYTYLFEFGKLHDIREEVNEFLTSADTELIQEMFQKMLTLWKPA